MENQKANNYDGFKAYSEQFKYAMSSLLVDDNKRYNALQKHFAEVNEIDADSTLALMFVSFCLGADSETELLTKAVKAVKANEINLSSVDTFKKWWMGELQHRQSKKQTIFLTVPPFC